MAWSYLHWCTLRRHSSETTNITKVDGHTLIVLCRHTFTLYQLVGYRPAIQTNAFLYIFNTFHDFLTRTTKNWKQRVLDGFKRHWLLMKTMLSYKITFRNVIADIATKRICNLLHFQWPHLLNGSESYWR